MAEAARVLKLPLRSLSARPLGPLAQSDGSPYTVAKWARLFVVAVEAKPHTGLMARNVKQKEMTDQLLTSGVEDVQISAPSPSIDAELMQENALLKQENAQLKAQIFLLEEKLASAQGTSFQ
ncbi:hypothetical protein GOP47_0027074 [Adiantum capillus-veneris]|nr:hypothetical protein GOP47_0027074 [Adiantum capillus-veneris]